MVRCENLCRLSSCNSGLRGSINLFKGNVASRQPALDAGFNGWGKCATVAQRRILPVSYYNRRMDRIRKIWLGRDMARDRYIYWPLVAYHIISPTALTYLMNYYAGYYDTTKALRY